MVELHEMAHGLIVLFAEVLILGLRETVELCAMDVEAVRAGEVAQVELEIPAVLDEQFTLNPVAPDGLMCNGAESGFKRLR